MRVALLLFLLSATLLASGCASQDQSTTDASGTTTTTTSAAPHPSAVDVQDAIDLTAGVSGRHWNFTVGPGFSDGHVSFSLQSLQGQPVRGTGQYCLKWELKAEATSNGSEGSCGSGNVVVQNPSATSEEVLVDWPKDHLAPGTYTFDFDAAPQAAQLVVDIVVTYQA